MTRKLLLPASILFTITSCTGVKKNYDDVADTVKERTGYEAPVPGGQLGDADVESAVRSLLAKPLTASSGAQIALLNSKRVRATLEELNLSQADLLEASLPANPSLASSVRWPKGGGGANSEFGLAADVINWLLLPLKRNMAIREYEAAKKRVTHELLEVVFDTKEAFYELQAEQQLLLRLQTAAEVNNISSEIAKRLRDAGNITALELLQEQTNSQAATIDIARSRGGISIAREKVNRLLGLTTAEGKSWRFAQQLPSLPGSEPAFARLEAAAIANRQDLAATREELAALEMGLSLTRKMRFIPVLNVGVDTEREVDGGRLTGPSVELEVPIFNRGQGRVLKSEAQLAQARANLAAMELEVRSDVRRALQQVQNARTLYSQISGTLLPQRQKILGETLLQYNAMQVSNFVLLQAKADEVEAQKEQVEALKDYWTARAELEKAAGGSLTWATGKLVKSVSPHRNH